MEDRIISFKVAILAKEVGFNIPCEYCFMINTRRITKSKNTIRECYAPTQSLLQKYLREVHNEIVLVTINFSENNEILYDYDHYSNLIAEEIDYNDGYFNTYEEALEAGLERALNLIKDDNNRN